jgi:eukaryotic-like serine/threonine-protein kinase
MKLYGFSANSQIIFSRIIKVERIKKLQKFPFIRKKEVTIDYDEALGSGSSGGVFKAEYQHAVFAVKIFHKHVNDSAEFQREIRACSFLFHPNIVSLTGVVVDNKDEHNIVGVLMEKMDCTLLQKVKNDSPPPKQILRWCFEAAKAILCAHSSNIIHSDIKPDNILLSTSNPPVAKLADFGSASLLNATRQSTVGHLRGTAQYIAPEKLRTGPTPATDVFALGMTIWAVLHINNDFGLGKTAEEAKTSLANGVRPKFTNANVPPEVKELVEKCWSHDSSSRPTIDHVLNELKNVLTKG